MPTSQEIFDVGPCSIHDSKSGDVDGAVLDHLALPSVIHYLILRKQPNCNVSYERHGAQSSVHRNKVSDFNNLRDLRGKTVLSEIVRSVKMKNLSDWRGRTNYGDVFINVIKIMQF